MDNGKLSKLKSGSSTKCKLNHFINSLGELVWTTGRHLDTDM